MMFLRDQESSGSVAVEESPPTQARGKTAPAYWTVLAYLAGDNDLEDALLDDLREMERVGSRPGAVEILAQLDRTPGGDASAGDWSGTRRYYVTRSASPSRIGSKLLADLGRRLPRAPPAPAQARGIQPDKRLVARLGEGQGGRGRGARGDRSGAAGAVRVRPGAPPGDPGRPRWLLRPLRGPARPAHDALDRGMGARDVVLPRLPHLPVPLHPLLGEALRQELDARAPGPRLLQRLAGHGPPDVEAEAATLHDPAVIRKILAHVGIAPAGPSPGPAPPAPGVGAP